MKSFIIACSILFVLIVGVFCFHEYICHFSEFEAAKSDEVFDFAKNNEWEFAQISMEEIKGKWEKNVPILQVLVDGAQIEALKLAIAETETSVFEENEHATANASKMKELFVSLETLNMLTFANVL